MVSSVLVELVGDAGEAPPSSKSGDDGVKCISCCPWTTRVGEVDIAGMKVKSHGIRILVKDVPVGCLGSHSVGTWGLGDTPEIYKKARYNITRAFWSVTPTLTRPQVNLSVPPTPDLLFHHRLIIQQMPRHTPRTLHEIAPGLIRGKTTTIIDASTCEAYKNLLHPKEEDNKGSPEGDPRGHKDDEEGGQEGDAVPSGIQAVHNPQ